MIEKYMFSGATCAAAVSAGVACFFMGLVMLLTSIWEGKLESSAVNVKQAIFLSMAIWAFGWGYFYMSWKSSQIKRISAFRISLTLIIISQIVTVASIVKIYLL